MSIGASMVNPDMNETYTTSDSNNILSSDTNDIFSSSYTDSGTSD
jgi:hypothetical protein